MFFAEQELSVPKQEELSVQKQEGGEVLLTLELSESQCGGSGS